MSDRAPLDETQESEHGYSEDVTAKAAHPDRLEIRRALDLLWGQRDRLELRIIHRPSQGGRPTTEAGVFDRDHLDDLLEYAVGRNDGATVCVNLNPILPTYSPPIVNSLGRASRGLFSNPDAAGREYLLIDCDPVRPSDTSASEAEVEAARVFASAIRAYLESLSWQDPVICESGNGVHLLYRVALPNDELGRRLVQGVLDALGKRFDNDNVKVDRSVSKAGQIVKLYGTVATKGLSTIERPHRTSRVVSVPTVFTVVTVDQLQRVLDEKECASTLGLGPRPSWLPSVPTDLNAPLAGTAFDLVGFLRRLDIPHTRKVKADGTESYTLARCPFNSAHNRGEAGISRSPEGRLGFHCFHNSCAGKSWQDVRALVESRSPFPTGGAAAGLAGTINNEVVPQRLPPTLREVPTFDPELLPTVIRAAAIDTAERLQCPIEYLAVGMLAAAGSAVGNRVGIYPKARDESWEVYPALWGGIVGDPGSKKTPAMQAALKPLNHIDDQAAQNYAKAVATHKLELARFQAAWAKWNKDKSGLEPTEPPAPVRERLVVNDTTYQALGVILAKNPRGVIAIGDELSGLLNSLDAQGQEAARGFFLAGWSGTQGYSFDRVERGTVILQRYCLGVFGGFQPDRIKVYVKGTQRGMATNDGLLQRFQLLVWPDPLLNQVTVDRMPNKEALDAYFKGVLRLRSLSSSVLPAAVVTSRGSLLLHFDTPAQASFDEWYQANEAMLVRGRLDPAQQSHFAKYRSLVPALALLYHLLEGHDGAVCLACTRRAIEMAKLLKAHAIRIYSSVAGYDHEATRVLAEHLLKGDLPDGFTRRAIVMKGWTGLSTNDDAGNAVEALVELGWLAAQEQRLGRPTVRYYVNPRISPDLL